MVQLAQLEIIYYFHIADFFTGTKIEELLKIHLYRNAGIADSRNLDFCCSSHNYIILKSRFVIRVSNPGSKSFKIGLVHH
ncbi:hypothetical protein EVA_08553 [gut metagenome]|uniref:Uncharacterized protein n=1 Tax=gut metagenome TaxID=749906 RepID=J9G7V5_9ZZZZ